MHFCVVIQKPKSMRLTYFLTVCLLAAACTPKPAEFKTGVWRGLIDMQGQQLPFNFEVAKDDSGYKVYLLNAEEKLLQDEITVTHDSVKIVMLIFDIELQAKINGNTLSGTYIKNYDPKNKLPFTATFGEDYRFVKKGSASTNFTGKYHLTFRNEKESYPAVGVIKQEDNIVTGTFLTPTGDYRYLQGNVIENKVWLSTFDGNHAFLFSAFIDGDSLRGDFYSGKTSHETFSGIKNENAALPDLESLTFLKEGYDQISFSFPDVDNNMISPSDEKYDKKVLILQLFGTWCPNCSSTGEEKLLQDEITVTHDSKTSCSFSILNYKENQRQHLSGTYIKNYDPKNKLPFTATFGEDYRFVKKVRLHQFHRQISTHVPQRKRKLSGNGCHQTRR